MITLAEIFGQERAIDWLRAAYTKDRLPHAMIFVGMEGVGRETTALALAQLFLCERPKDAAACGRCKACLTVATGTHPDLHLVYRELVRFEKKESKAIELSVDVIRHYLIAPAAHTSSENIGKVFIVREADRMNASAQNALLKTLEEPAGRTLVILICEQLEQLRPTIRSRAQVVQFSALDEARVRRELEVRGKDSALAAQAARLSRGSLGLALRWLEDGVIEQASQLEKIIQRGDSAALRTVLKAAADAYAAAQIARDKNASKDNETRTGLLMYLTIAGQVFRDELANDSADPRELDRACAAIDALRQAETLIESNVNMPLVIQQLSGALSRGANSPVKQSQG